MAMASNPKLLISHYYDSLVNLIDVHTEELLEKVSDTHELSSDSFNLVKNYHEMSNEFFVKPDNFVPTYGVDSYVDPYTDTYNNKLALNPLELSKTPIKIRDYLQSIRTRMIDELRRSETQTMELYEAIRKDETYDITSAENLKNQLFSKKFYLIVKVDRIRLEAFETVANRSWFKIYLVELDFYLDMESQEFLKNFMNECFEGFLFMGDQPYDLNLSREVNATAKLNFNKRSLIPHMLKTFIFGQFKMFSTSFTHIFHITKNQLLSINKLVYRYMDLYFDVIRFSNRESCEPKSETDFDNLKSLSIYNNAPMFEQDIAPEFHSLSNLSSLEYLDVRNFHLGRAAFHNLTQLRKLVLVNCDFTNIDDQSLKSLPFLEVLENLYPKNCDHLTYQHLVELKLLKITNVVNLSSLNFLTPSLIVLELSSSLTDSNIAEFFHSFRHPNLKVLHLNETKLSLFDGTWLAGLKNLRHFKIDSYSLRSFKLSSPPCLVDLESIGLHSSKIESLEGAFHSLVGLKSLDISYNKHIRLHPNMFAGLNDSLEELYLEGMNQRDYFNQHSRELFRELSKLKCLKLKRNMWNQLDPDMFIKMSSLVKLDLSWNNFKLDKSSFAHLKHLEQLDLSRNSLESLEPGVFFHLSNLKILNLSDNLISRIDKDTFEGLAQLKKLCLRENRLQHVHTEAFSSMANLEEIDLFRTYISLDLQRTLKTYYESIVNLYF